MREVLRHEILKYLPNLLTKKELQQIRDSTACELTGQVDDLTVDHFIPLGWGHGGVYLGNIFSLGRKLNSSKSNINPFKWITKPEVSEIIDVTRWNALIQRLAKDNDLTIVEFENYVNWCEKNKRTLNHLEKKKNNFTSVDLWKKSCRRANKNEINK